MSADLAQLQTWLAAVITRPQSVAAGLRAAQGPCASAMLAPHARLSADAQLEIYHSGYRARLCECLADDYPALQHALGHAAFRALCLDYIARFPSRSPSLNRFGAGIAEFCRGQARPEAECWAELASLEWAVVEVIHAADAEALPVSAFKHLTPAQFGAARLQGARALRLLEQRFAVNHYYSTFRHSQAAQLGAEAHTYTLVQRRGLTVYRRELPSLTAALLRELLAGKPVAQALSAALTHASDAVTAEAVNAAFEQLFTLGCFVSMHEGRA